MDTCSICLQALKNDKPLTVNTLLANEISSENITFKIIIPKNKEKIKNIF